MKVAVVAEFYPRANDPVLGVWAHEQARAAQAAGAEIHVVVTHRLVPPAAALRAGPRTAAREFATLLRQPRHTELDGIPITYVPFVSRGRSQHYGDWGGAASRPLHFALRRLHRRFPYELLHAHNAVPAADALQRRPIGVPLITSVHGGDVFYTALQRPEWATNVRRGLDASALVLANSSGIAQATRKLTNSAIEVLLLGAHVPEAEPRPPRELTLITVAHVIGRKRHADVIRAMWVLRERWPNVRYKIVGDGPARPELEALVRELGLVERVEFLGQLPHAQALEQIDQSTLAVMPSVDEAYGVAYVEAMAHGVPTIGSLGEPGPLDLADLGSGIQLVAPGDVEHLARVIGRLLANPSERARLSKLGRRVVAERCSWEVSGAATVDAYRRVIAGEVGRGRAAQRPSSTAHVA